jgi:hypothetical protein
MLSQGVVMLCDNARPHTAAATQDLIAIFRWEQFDHAPYSPDLVPSDSCVPAASQVASFYNAGIQKLVPHYDKCLNNGGNC